MGKNLTPRRKAAIVNEATKYRDQVTGRLPKNALKAISLKFDGISERTIKSYCTSAKRQEEAGILSIDLNSKMKGVVGRKSKLTEALKDVYRDIIKEYAYTWRRLTHRVLRSKLSDAGFDFPLSTVQAHLKVLKARHKVVKLKPLLTDTHKENRLRFVMDQVDRRHVGRGHELKFRDHFDTIMVDESWMYLMRNDNKLLLVEDIDVLIAPQVQHKSHIEKIMFLAVVGRPQRRPDGTWWDGKIGIFPCIEEVATKRKSKLGPKGTLKAINKNVDSEFYHNLFSEQGGVFDKIEEKRAENTGTSVDRTVNLDDYTRLTNRFR
jgi:hypothetical protein